MRFHIFRYQIIPLERNHPIDVISGISSIEELLEKKNQFFSESLVAIKIDRGKSEMNKLILFSDEDSFLLRMNVSRSKKIETKDFKTQVISSWPSIYVIILNHKEQQLILVQEKPEAFQQAESLVKAIEKSLNENLKLKNLIVRTKSLFKVEEFWNIVKPHYGKIRRIRFELITPNMSNISQTLAEDLKKFAKDSNASQTNLAIQASPGMSLDVVDDNKYLDGLAQYASKGGGNVSVKISGIKKEITTATGSRTIEVEDAEITGKTGQEIIGIIKSILSVENV